MSEYSTPLLREELDRKLVEFLNNREIRRIQENIAPEVIGIECGALWDVVAGLANPDIVGMLATLESNAVRPPVRRLFIRAGTDEVVALSYQREKAGWSLNLVHPREKTVVASETDAGPIRDQLICQLVESLTERKYKEL